MSRSLLNFIGVAILVVGLGIVALVERNAQKYEASLVEDTEATHALLYPQDSREYVRNSELMNGKLMMIILGWWQDVEGWGHSRSFAMVVAVVSVAAATLVFKASIFSDRE